MHIPPPPLHQVEPLRESNFCGRVGGLVGKSVAIMLKLALKIRHILVDELTSSYAVL